MLAQQPRLPEPVELSLNWVANQIGHASAQELAATALALVIVLWYVGKFYGE